MTIERQLPWRLDGRSAPIAIACLAIGIACGFLAWSGNRTRAGLQVAAIAALILALASWLAWCAVTWFVGFSRRETGSYLQRHAGLLWGMPMWSLQTFRYIQNHGTDGMGSIETFSFALALILPAPFALWGGVAMQYVFDSVFRKRKP